MLQKLVFQLNDDRINNSEARGSLLQIQTDDPTETVIGVNPDHPFNKKYGFTEGIVYYIKELEPGVYLGGFDLEHTIELLTDFKASGSSMLRHDGEPIQFTFENYQIYGDNIIETHGVADNIEQIKERFKSAIDHPTNKIVISVTEIRREDEPEYGGWRWHKWGEYIGTKQPTCEYLHDEKDIDSVFCFQILWLKEPLLFDGI